MKIEGTENLYFTQFIYACWFLSGSSPAEKSYIPCSDSAIDYALQEMVKEKHFPDWVANYLRFVSGDSGLECPEMHEAENLADILRITSAYDHTRHITKIDPGSLFFNKLLNRLEIELAEAVKIGSIFRVKIAQFQEQMRSAVQH